MTPAFTLSLLGQFALTNAAGCACALRSRKARALLAYLALRPNGRETRERLATLLWGDMGEERARANLRNELASLRRLIGADRLVNDGDAVVVALEGLAVDARELLAAAALPAHEDRWERALAAYRGELLADVTVGEAAFEDWVRVERRRCVEAALAVGEKLAAARREAGDVDDAERALKRLLELEPTSERLHRALMQLYAASGRRGSALAQFEQCREALHREFGVAPARETLALHRSLCEGSPAPAAARALGRGSALPLPDKPSLAVLPFANRSGPEWDWFSDGLAEDVIVGLSKFGSLLVIARQSSFAFRAEPVDVLEVGRALGVHYVLAGSVRRAAGQLRVTVQLSDAGSRAAVWAHSYDGEVGDLFALIDNITSQLVATLVGRIEAAQLDRVTRKPTESLEAYDLYLKGKAYHHRYTAHDNAVAQECLERALALDPSFAQAHAWLACVLAQGNSFRPRPEAFEEAYAHVLRARELEDGDSECHRILAAYYLVRRRFEEAQAHQARALALNPNDDRIVCQMGELLTFLGRPDEALPWIEAAMRLNPYHADTYYYEHGRALYDAGRASEAAAALRRIGRLRPAHRGFLAACCVRVGDREGAAEQIDVLRRERPDVSAERFAAGLPYREPGATARLETDLREAGLA